MRKWRIGVGGGPKCHSCTTVMREWHMPRAMASIGHPRMLHLHTRRPGPIPPPTSTPFTD